MTNEELLKELADVEGFENEWDMLEEVGMDSVVPAICKNEDCLMTGRVEPDQDRGWCEGCEQNTMVSCLVLAGVI